MDSYWLSFRLKDSDGYEATYDERLDDLHEAVEVLSGGGSNMWLETTSFYIFQSNASTSVLIAKIKAAIDPDVDLVVLGMHDYKGGWVIGALEDRDILTLIPLMQRV